MMMEHVQLDQVRERCDIVEIDAETQRPEWLDRRRTGLGGSDIGAILGLSPYKSGFRLWLEKTGQLEEEDLGDVEAVHWGNVLESVVAAEYAERTGAIVENPKSMFFDRRYPFLFANPDDLFLDAHTGELGILECKTAGHHVADYWADGATPPWYEGQGVHYGAVLGIYRVDIAVLIAGQRFEIRTLRLDPELVNNVRNAAIRWWTEHVIGGSPPPVDATSDCTDALGKLWTSADKVAMLDEQTIAYAVEYLTAHKAMKAAEEAKALAGNRLRSALGEHWIGAYDGQPIATWKPAKQLDEAALAAAHPELYAMYCTKFDRKAFEADHPAIVGEFKTETDRDRRLLVKPAALSIYEALPHAT